jgi:CRISPR-associated endoribonuclease Cas6
MPAALRIPLLVSEPPAVALVHLPDLFLDCLAAGDASLAACLRDTPPPRPYTLSRFYRRDGCWVWRVTLLRDDLLDPLQAGLERMGALPLAETQVPLDVAQIKVWRVSYEELLERAADERHIRLRFISPTSFRTGLASYPLPDPLVLFQSWWRRWNTFAPLKLERVLLDVAAVHLAVARHDLHTQVVDLGVGQVVGFIGSVTLRVIQAHKLGDVVLRRINALADYAAFCGAGQRTAQGMGQTRRYG